MWTKYSQITFKEMPKDPKTHKSIDWAKLNDLLWAKNVKSNIFGNNIEMLMNYNVQGSS